MQEGVDGRVGVVVVDHGHDVGLAGGGRQVRVARGDAQLGALLVLHGHVVGAGRVVADQQRAQTRRHPPIDQGGDAGHQIGLDQAGHQLAVELLRSHEATLLLGGDHPDRRSPAHPAQPAVAAAPGEFAPLPIGPLEVWPPVVLAPMAGVTNAAFRRLCRQFGAGLYVSEMVNARGLAEGGERSWELAAFDPDESPRSIQLYGTDPAAVSAAVTLLVDAARVDHIDLNFGCPVRKVTRHGGGAAVPVRPALLASIIARRGRRRPGPCR